VIPSSRQDALHQPDISVAFDAFAAASEILQADGDEELRLTLAQAIVTRVLAGERDLAKLRDEAVKVVSGRDG
jgi:hypothetical protein